MTSLIHKSRWAVMLTLFLSFGTQIVAAQACSSYFPLDEGTRIEYEITDEKGKSAGSQWQEIISVAETAEGSKAQMRVGYQDAKGKETFKTEYGFICSNNVVRIDYSSLMSGPAMEQFKEAEMEITGTDIEWPNNLSVGMTLPDASVNMKMSMGGMNMQMNTNITARKVEKRETVSTPAGNFDCFVIYSETQAKVMMSNQTVPSRTWLAEGVGMVKNESYNKNGKLMSRIVLSKFTK
ncbi:hypothetical protein N9L94_05500 [Robiginitalea sp.]|nr:hypothetical protein [Robiginitalea sp.]